MANVPALSGTVLLLHGMAGGWDELIILAAGIILAVVVVKWTSRSSRDDDDEELGSADRAIEKRPEQT
jgi:hypothetical protein